MQQGKQLVCQFERPVLVPSLPAFLQDFFSFLFLYKKSRQVRCEIVATHCPCSFHALAHEEAVVASQLAIEDTFEGLWPGIGREEGKRFAFCDCGRRGRVPRRQKQAAIAGGEKFGGFFASGKPDFQRRGVERALVELGKFAHTRRSACADG